MNINEIPDYILHATPMTAGELKKKIRASLIVKPYCKGKFTNICSTMQPLNLLLSSNTPKNRQYHKKL